MGDFGPVGSGTPVTSSFRGPSHREGRRTYRTGGALGRTRRDLSLWSYVTVRLGELIGEGTREGQCPNRADGDPVFRGGDGRDLYRTN